jgi:ketosteroid isomerase-like protein
MVGRSSLLKLAWVLAAFTFCVQHDDAQQASSNVAGTWFGSFVISNPNDKVSHETAVLVIDHPHSNLSGSMGRTVDEQTTWVDGSFTGNKLHFHLDAAGGMNVNLKLFRGHLVGTATGEGIQAQIDLKPAAGLLPHQQLQQEILTADRELYEAFGSCDIARYASFLTKDLEFYQDHTGETGYEENLRALQDRCAEGIRLRRELEEDSFVVNAAPGFGAIEAGTQRFYSRDQDGQEHLDATARFTNVWSKKSGTWKLVRVISYDHR